MKKIRIMTVFGTRPEAIKMFPLVKEIELDSRFESIVVVTGQHRQMLDQILNVFNIIPDYDLNIMKSEQTLTDVTTRVLTKLSPIIRESSPDVMLVHGDTTTTFAAALSAFYEKVSIGHVEAGLRTWDKYSPFPEEMNRQLTDTLTDMYFAPTEISKKNLLNEGVKEKKIFITGNTAIDAMKYTVKKETQHKSNHELNRKKILVTMHRRENIGEPMKNVFKAINRLVRENADIQIVFPIHKNPVVRKLANDVLIKTNQIQLIEPLDVLEFHNLIANSYLVLTDSGGIQEEAPSLGVPVLVLRDTTERPEGVSAGTLKLVGTDEINVYDATKILIKNEEQYKEMSQASNPYGDGYASQRILEAIASEFFK